MAQTRREVSFIDTAHRDPIHATQLDHFGKRLATASGDHTVCVWDVATRAFVTKLSGHAAPVFAVAWSHPMFGPLLASAGHDQKVIFWREGEGEWFEVDRYDVKSPVLAIAFAPWEYELQLAVACGDGQVHVLKRSDDSIDDGASGLSAQSFPTNHDGGTFAICWAPASCPVKLDQADPNARRTTELSARRLVTGGGDRQVRIWRHDENTDQWVVQNHLTDDDHKDWVRDVAWRPNVGIPANSIASCAEDGSVVIWTQPCIGSQWQRATRQQVDSAAWQVSWSATGSILAVATSSNQVYLYNETLNGKWELAQTLSDQEA